MGKPGDDGVTRTRSYQQVVHACDLGITYGIAESDEFECDGWVMVISTAVTVHLQRADGPRHAPTL